MQFASSRISGEWNDARLNPLVKQITNEAAAYALSQWNWDFYLTSIYRTPAEDLALGGSGVHVAWRAVDARDSDQVPAAITDVTNYINSRWVYDPQRPTMKVCFSDPHGTGPHMHFQSHPNTVPVPSTSIKPSKVLGASASDFAKGIDLSRNNGTIDWTKLKSDTSIEFVLIRLSLGYGTIDKMAEQYAIGAKGAGKKISYYHFAYPDPKVTDNPDITIDAMNEANYFRNLVSNFSAKGLAPDFSLAIDLEDDPKYQPTRILSPAEYLRWLKAFFTYFPGPVYQPLMIYGSPGYLDTRLPSGHGLGVYYPLWVAHWGAVTPQIPRGWTTFKIWQYSKTGTASGITGAVDMDVMDESVTPFLLESAKAKKKSKKR